MERMYIVVNSDLAMGKGKVAAQVGHGVAAVIRYMENNAVVPEVRRVYEKWSVGSETKIVVKASEDTLLHLAAKYPRSKATFCMPVLDAGRTQIPHGSLTVIAFVPLEEKSVPAELRALKLL